MIALNGRKLTTEDTEENERDKHMMNWPLSFN